MNAKETIKYLYEHGHIPCYEDYKTITQALDKPITEHLDVQKLISKTVVLQAKYDTLHASHSKLVEVIEAAIRIKDIWTLPTNEACFHNEAVALQTMRTNFEQALKEAKEII